MHRTTPLLKGRMISAVRGQRRILKRRVPLLEYIEKAVQTGIYRSNEEISAAMKAIRRGDTALREPQIAADRFRRDIVRGTQVQDYPAEYHILKMYPPLPPPPKIPKKMRRKMELARKRHPKEKLVLSYLKRQDKPKATTEDYYRHLLGVRPPPDTSVMGQKSAALSKAYAYAVKQYEVMRGQDLSEKEALKVVDDLLAEDSRKEAQTSRSATEDIQEWKKDSKAFPKEGLTYDNMNEYVPSIMYDQPRIVQGMLEWSRMLQESGIPYSEWTVGASTALDHWIARNVLEMSENTWDQLLEGADPSLLSRGQDIVAVREVLFPETRMTVDDDGSESFVEEREEEERARDERAAASLGYDPPSSYDDEPESPSTGRSVDELLKSLRNLPADEPKTWSFEEDALAEPTPPTPTTPTPTAGDTEPAGPRDPIQILADELQEWRAMNVETDYEQWSAQDKQRFSQWMDEYLDTLTTEVDRPLIDLEETRIALLSAPPQSEEESKTFWSQLQDETKADIFLQNLLQQGPPAGISQTEKAFWDMPYEDQLEKLVNLGTLRPLLDDYMDDAKRIDFLRRYGDYLLDGVELDHLVPDPNGPITGMELGAEIVRSWNVQQDDRFKLVKLPYRGGLTGDPEEDDEFLEEGDTGSDAAMRRSRALYEVWNRHKAGRARYEEELFARGDLGLSYDTKSENEMWEEYQKRSEKEDDPVIDPKKPKGKKKK